MKKAIIRISIFVLAVVFVSCSGTKKITEQEIANAAVNKPVEKIAEQKQMEFEYLFLEALKQKMFGNMQKAIQLLSSCLEIDPNSSAAMFELANIHAANNDFTSASLLLEKAISLNGDNKWYKQLLAQIYQQQRKFSEAADIYTQLLQDDPENMELLYTKAILLSNAQKFDEAIATYDLMEKKAGINEQLSVAKQQLYVTSGNIDGAFNEIEKLIEFDPEEAKYYGLLADLYLSTGDSVKALENYNKILVMDPQNGFVHFSLANYYISIGEIDKAYEETKIGFSSDNVDIQNKLQLYMMLISNREKSKITDEKEEELIQILLEKHPDEFLVYTVYAESLLKKQKLPEARIALLKALDIQPDDYMMWERVLFIDNDLQDWEALHKHSKETIGLFPNQPQGYLLNAVATIQLEKFEETITVTEEGIDFIIDNPQLEGQFLMLKGEAVYKLDRKPEAFKLFDKAISLDPENYIAMNNYAYYLSLDGGDLNKAERMSGKVVQRFPNNSTYLDTHAWVLFKKGEYKLAKFYMESAIKNGGDKNATLLEHYGDILFMSEKLDEAKEYWEKAKENGGNSEVLLRKIREQKYFEE
ncbi:MAG: tetratricopeptide repeat protein [Draconibacterium sp.]|nr:tetratricopeptide repeat protein [Draconibacterium sp.]